ncbi:MAG: serine/threonine protein kinase, partial [Planctomycetes bacterium]|nr:serine/threonine protein kinase [Planctomycetota bacterium]
MNLPSASNDAVPSPDDLKRKLGQTVASDQFSAEAFHTSSAETAAAVQPASDAAPVLSGPSLIDRLHARAQPGVAAAEERFQVRNLLGTGATARVYAVVDRDLKREVAVKILDQSDPQDIDHFLEEAQIAASLEHPNVLPVHDIDVNASGQVYFTMKRIEGQSLGGELASSSRDERSPRIRSFNAVVSIFIGVAHAVAFAHHRGIVHQDIKPDNIMLGGFGEILLVDWGSATRLDDAAPRLYGTPLYMSPEQARMERADRLSDIYCLGSTLFHALTLRFPTWSDDAEEFWRKKRSGTIDAPTAAERAAIPAPLLAIALKAIEPAAASRYATIESFIEDLAHYQAGLAVSAHRDTLRERWARWYRMHRRGLWGGLAVGVVIVALVALLYGERLKEIATWGEPVVEQT